MPDWLSSVRDLIADASPLRRFMLALLVLLPLAALAAAYIWFNPPLYRVLYTQLSDRSGGEVIAALEQLDIPYRLSAADGTIEVPTDQMHVARYRLAAQGLPRTDADAEDEADRVPSFGASSLQEQQRYQRALEVDLARSIQKLETVELARVHLAMPKVSPFLRDAPSATAAVLVRLRHDAHLSVEQVTTIQTLVAASVPRMKRADVQVLDPSGVLLGAAPPVAVQSQRLLIEQDLARRALAVLTPWLGKNRVSVQVTATLEDSETRQTVEQVRSAGVGGSSRPLEKTVRTTRLPEGRIQRLNAIVIMGFDASANQRWRAGQMTSQALGMQLARGDSVKVFALPAAVQAAPETASLESQAEPESQPQPEPASQPKPPAPISIPQVRSRTSPLPQVDMLTAYSQWWPAAAVGAGVLLGGLMWWRARRVPAPELPIADMDAELEAMRNQVQADPRVTADVIKLWMRA
ncbi:MAG: flagellar basal-body MS-ring/collar protein FliF [Thiobacillus sp.]